MLCRKDEYFFCSWWRFMIITMFKLCSDACSFISLLNMLRQ